MNKSLGPFFFTPDVNKAKTCNLVIDLYTKIIKLPEKDAGSILRTMFLLINIVFRV